MDHEMKLSLAKTGDVSKEAAAMRLAAARRAAGLSQEALASAIGLKKAAISNAENAQSFPSRPMMIYLYRAHRIDLNFLITGDFVQLPGDVQARLFDELASGQIQQGQMQG